MENNNGSKPSMCRKIRDALGTRPAEKPVTIDSNFPSSPPIHAAKPKPAIKTETHLPQHLKGDKTEGVVAAEVEPKPLYHVSMQGIPATKADHSGGMASEQHHGRKDHDFSDFIAKARAKLRVMSNIGRGQSNHAPDEAKVNKINDNHRDKFSSFIHRGRKRFRLSSNIGKTGS